MSVQISGVLKDGAGKPVQGCTIQLNAKKTSPTVVVEMISSTVTDANGHYSIEAEPGYYSVSLLREGFPPSVAGDIYVAPTDAPDTLNAFLDAPKDADLRPEVMKRFEEMVNRVVDLSGATEKDRERAEQAAQSAEQSKDSAALSATAAAESQKQSARSADAADVSARSADDNARQTAQDVLACAADADSAAKSAQTATEQAGQAKTAADAAQIAQQEAGASAQSAAGSAESAAASAQSAGEHAGNAAASETSARESALTATQAAEQSDSSAAAAALSEQHARESSEKAAKSEAAASASAELASSSDASALQSAETAEKQKSAAAESATRAEQARDEALTSRNEAVEAAETAATDAAEKATGKVSEQLKAAVADDTQRAEAAMAGAESAAVASQGYRDEARDIAESLKLGGASTTQKGLVQLSSATDSNSEELAATPKAVKAVMDEAKTKAPLDSPALAGTPTTPTPDASATGLEIANAAFVRLLIAALVDSVPESLDTLQELADALGNDPNFSTTVLNALAGKQPLNDILTSLSGLVTAGNKLAYFTDKNVMALANLTAVGRVLIGQNSKSDVLNYLGLKSAATKDVQSDIYDRTEGRLAIPGAFGYGAIFTSARYFSPTDGPSEFLSWVTEMAPGKYCVSQSWGANYNPILNINGKNINFSGVVEIIIPDILSINENQTEKDKLVIFYGVNGDVCINRLYGGAFMGWESLIFGAKNVADTLRSSGGVTNGYTYPDIGGLVFAAYCGKADDDAARKIWRGSVVAGSRLAVVSITAPHNPTGSYASTPQVVVAPLNLCPMAGTFVALSGSPLTSGGNTSAMIGLFVRIA